MSGQGYRHLGVERKDGGVVVVAIDVQDQSQNVFSQDVMGELSGLVGTLANDAATKVIVFRSKKAGSFFAGANVKEFGGIKNAVAAEEASRTGQELFARIEGLKQKTIAAIHGVCLGGGLEFALSCDYRFASEDNATSDGERVYAQFYDQEHLVVVCCDLNGNLIWDRDFGAIQIQHGPGASMIVYENLLIVPMEMDTPSQMFGLDKKTGKTVWQVARESDRATYATPCVLKNGGKEELVCPANVLGISGLDPKTGKMLWSMATGLPERVVSSPVLTDSLILTQCGSGGNGRVLIGIGFQPEMKIGAVQPVLTMSKNLPYVVTPVAHDGILYLWCDRGVVRGIGLRTGDELWTGRVSGNFSASPVIAGEKLYGVSEDGQLTSLALGREFKVLGRTELGEGSCATPAIASGKMILRTESHLIALDAEK